MLANKPTIVMLVEAAGGVLRHVLDLYHGLKARFSVRLVLSPHRIDRRYKEELSKLGPDVTYVSMQRAPHPSDLAAVRQVREILHGIPGPKILHCHSTKAGLLGTLLRLSVDAMVLTPHAYRGLDPELSRSMRAVLGTIEGTYSRRFDCVIVLSEAELEYALRQRVPRQMLQLIPNGIRVDHLDFPQIMGRRASLHSVPVLGFVGRIAYQKNPLLFLQAMHEVVKRGVDVEAIIIGDGSLEADMKSLANQLNLEDRISWRGPVRAADIYPEMDVMVHTSRYEGLPYSLLEACADLLPIVATPNPGSTAVLGDLLPTQVMNSHEPGPIAENVILLLQDAELRRRQMRKLAEIADRYSRQTMLTRHAQLYDSLSASMAD